jgi:hypothetical protein
VEVEAVFMVEDMIQGGSIAAVVVDVVLPGNKPVVDGPGIPRILVIILKTSGIALARLSAHVFLKLGHNPNRFNPG